MERWTVIEPSEGRYKIHINFGGPIHYWCQFDFAVEPAPEVEGVEIRLAADADSVAAEWFPHLRAGMIRGLENAPKYGRTWQHARIEVRKVIAHSIDTTAYGCEQYGFRFVTTELPHRGVRVGE
jgi:hypothetical protein